MSKEKNKATILYLCKEASKVNSLNSTKLNKALWYSDMVAYMKTGKKITSFSYVKQAKGPTPNPKDFLSLRSEMVRGNELNRREREFLGYVESIHEAAIDPNVEVFTSMELEILNNTIDDIKYMSAADVSERSHNIGWKHTPNMSEMGPIQFLATHESLNEKEVSFFNELISA